VGHPGVCQTKAARQNHFVALAILAILSIVIGCSSHQEQSEAVKTWDAFVQAVRRGDLSSARGLLASESQAHFSFDSTVQQDYLNSHFTVVKTETIRDYVELQVLKEKEGKQTALFKYVVKQGGQSLLQYPFILFAKAWPTVISHHFALHALETPASLYADTLTDTITPDTSVMERYYSTLTDLTGLQAERKIDYYFCQDATQAELLSGRLNFSWGSSGMVVISTKRYDFGEITRAFLSSQKTKTIDALHEGLVGYGEYQRVLHNSPDSDALEACDRTIAEHIENLGPHPVTVMIDSAVNHPVRLQSADFYYGSTGMVRWLIENGRAGSFRHLYSDAANKGAFISELQECYGKDLRSFESALQEKYDKYYHKGGGGTGERSKSR